MLGKKKVTLFLGILIVLQLGFITYMFAFQKEGFHSDDNWSYGFANADQGGWIEHDDNGKERNFNEWVDGKVLWDYITVQKGKEFNFGAVARNMSDERNPPLHHMILHFICSLFPETFSWWYAYVISILSFVGTIISLYFLGKEMFLSQKKALVACGFYGFSVAALNTALLLRPYSLLTFFAVLLIFFHVKMYRKKFKKCKWELIGILLTMIAGNLTQYTFMMFGMCIMAVFGVYELSMRRWKFAFLHGFVMLLSVGITVIIWPRALELLLTRNEMYNAQMPLLWEINFAMLLSVEEATGIPFKIPDIVFWTYVKFTFVFAVILCGGIGFICRKERWFQMLVTKMRERVAKMLKWAKRKICYGEKITIMIMLVAFLTLVVIAYYCNFYVMSIYSDRYLFFLMPFMSLVVVGQVSWLITHIGKRKGTHRLIIITLLCGLLFMEHKVLTPCWYLFKRQCEGPQIEELTKDADVILVTDEAWKLTWYSSKLRNVSKFCAFLSEDSMKTQTLEKVNELAKKEDNPSRPVYLVLETDKFREEDWDASKSQEKSGIKRNDEILTLSYKKSEVVNQFANAEWADQKELIQKEKGFTGNLEIWKLR